MAKWSYSVNIQPADNGFIVVIGCKTFVFKKRETEEFLSDLEDYLSGDSERFRALRSKYCKDEEIQEVGCDTPQPELAPQELI